MTSRPFDPSDPTAGGADADGAADAPAASCAELARWCDDADPYVSRDERALAGAERHLADCPTCLDRFGAELRFWAAVAAPEPVSASLTPTYRPPASALAGDADASALQPKRLSRIAVPAIVAAAVVVAAIAIGVRFVGGGPAIDRPSSPESADRTVTSAPPAPEVDPRFRPQFVTRAATGAPPAVPSDLRPSILLVRSADAPPAPVFAQSFSVEQRTPSSTSLLTFESAARTLAVRAP